MPSPIDLIGPTIANPSANEMVNSIGFSRPQGIAGTGISPIITGSGADSRETTFGSVLSDAVENVQTRQDYAKRLGVQAVTGRLSDVHSYTIAASESKLTLELTAAVRNKAVEAFNEIMRMQA